MSKRVRIFGVDVDALSMESAVGQISSWILDPRSYCRYVVTPNVDHVVKLSSDQDFMDAYRGAALVLADGKPVVWASHLLGFSLPGTVPGSDLVPAVFDMYEASGKELRVFLLGAAPGVADRAAEAMAVQWPTVRVVGTLSPPIGFEHNSAECERICACVNLSGADLLVLGLGAPKQELWVRKHAAKLSVKVALCVGATIDFLAGEKARAPRIFRTLGLEWFHRMLSEPRRLVRRYAYDAWVFPRLLFKEWLSRRSTKVQ